jgi:hypothetical protein
MLNFEYVSTGVDGFSYRIIILSFLPHTEVKLLKNAFDFLFPPNFFAPVPAEFTMLLQYYTQQGFRVIGAACKQLKVMIVYNKSELKFGRRFV